MKIAQLYSDYVIVNEENVNRITRGGEKVHLIKLDFDSPTKEKMDIVLDQFYDTRRFVVENNVRFYNYFFKNSSFKYYVENSVGIPLISFLRKNNKVLLNINNLSEFEKQFVLRIALEDILNNVEVMMMDDYDFNENKSTLESWNGNVILIGD